jgi:alpha-tubulin suppressor-like RCC1 family protein
MTPFFCRALLTPSTPFAPLLAALSLATMACNGSVAVPPGEHAVPQGPGGGAGSGAGGSGAGGAAADSGGTPATPGRFVELELGDQHACSLTADGELLCWGSNVTGELGDGTRDSGTKPVSVGEHVWRHVSSGAGTTCGVKRDGSLWCWGENASGQFALTGTPAFGAPERVETATDWERPIVGSGLICALKTDRSLWCKGRNNVGQLGRGDTKLSVDEPLARVGAMATWALVSVGDAHLCGVQMDGSLYCWGGNDHGEVGVGIRSEAVPTPTRIGEAGSWASVSVGLGSSCAIRQDGRLFCWGYDGTLPSSQAATPGIHEEPTQVGTSTTWTQVATRNADTCGIQQDGSLWCWGHEHVGDGAASARLAPVRVGAPALWSHVERSHYDTCAQQTGGSVWCWGMATELLAASGLAPGAADALLPRQVP